jgi:hypothetical protein
MTPASPSSLVALVRRTTSLTGAARLDPNGKVGERVGDIDVPAVSLCAKSVGREIRDFASLFDPGGAAGWALSSEARAVYAVSGDTGTVLASSPRTEKPEILLRLVSQAAV